MEEDAGGFANEVAAWQRVASDISGMWRWRCDLRREGPTGWGGRGNLGRVFGGILALCGCASDSAGEVEFYMVAAAVGLKPHPHVGY